MAWHLAQQGLRFVVLEAGPEVVVVVATGPFQVPFVPPAARAWTPR